MTHIRRLAIACVVFVIAACASPSSSNDAGEPGVDAGTIDAGTPDAGSPDAGKVDAGPIDAGPVDAGPIDAGPIDAGPIDAGPIDAGPIDAGPIDAGPIDAGPIDAGPIDAGPTFTPGTPITATADTWTWVPFDNAFCGSGTTTGIGVNLSESSSKVLIYLEGGGACWEETTCYLLKTATNFTGYGPTNFTADSTSTSGLAEPGGIFDRTSATNPFKDYSYVYVPYCTGDVHAGNNVVALSSGPANFVGYKNMTAYLERLVPTFPSAGRVLLTGSSAGGFGALLNWGQAQAAFGSVPVDMIDDSGALMPPDVVAQGAGYEPMQRVAWNLAATLPADCAACATRLDAVIPYYAQAFPNQKGALLSFTVDPVLKQYFGITDAQFTTGLDEEVTMQYAPNANMKTFVYAGTNHGLWSDLGLTTNGVTLNQFVTQMVTDDPAWASQHP